MQERFPAEGDQNHDYFHEWSVVERRSALWFHASRRTQSFSADICLKYPIILPAGLPLMMHPVLSKVSYTLRGGNHDAATPLVLGKCVVL